MIFFFKKIIGQKNICPIEIADRRSLETAYRMNSGIGQLKVINHNKKLKFKST